MKGGQLSQSINVPKRFKGGQTIVVVDTIK